jgi:hypothetical protein
VRSVIGASLAEAGTAEALKMRNPSVFVDVFVEWP